MRASAIGASCRELYQARRAIIVSLRWIKRNILPRGGISEGLSIFARLLFMLNAVEPFRSCFDSTARDARLRIPAGRGFKGQLVFVSCEFMVDAARTAIFRSIAGNSLASMIFRSTVSKILIWFSVRQRALRSRSPLPVDMFAMAFSADLTAIFGKAQQNRHSPHPAHRCRFRGGVGHLRIARYPDGLSFDATPRLSPVSCRG